MDMGAQEMLENFGIIFFDIILLIVAAILVPTAFKIAKSLGDILNSLKAFTSSLKSLCDEMKAVSEELTEARVRDNSMSKDIEHLKEIIKGHIESDTLQNIEKR